MDTRTLGEKIAAIAAMMEGATSIGEAEAATLAYQRVLLRHSLTEEDARKLTGKASDSLQQYRIVLAPAEFSPAREIWRSELLASIAHFSMCRVVIIEDTCAVMMYGTDANISAVKKFYEAAALTFMRLAPEAFDDTYEIPDLIAAFGGSGAIFDMLEMTLGEQQNEWILSYLRGAAVGVFNRMKLDRETEEADGQIAGLVLAADAAVERFMQEQIGDDLLEAPEIKTTGAFWKGYEDGLEYDPTIGRIDERGTELLALSE